MNEKTWNGIEILEEVEQPVPLTGIPSLPVLCW